MRFSGLFNDRILLLLFTVGLAIRLGVGIATPPDRRLLGDEGSYAFESARIERTGVVTTGTFVRPPLYFIVLAGVRGLPTPFLPTIVLLQCLASAATGLVVYRAVRRISNRRAARFSAAFLLLDPTLIGYSSLLWPETIYLLGVSLVFDAVTEMRPATWRRNAVVGALAGLCMLLKPVFGLFAPILAVWWWRRFGLVGAVRIAVVFGLATALVIAPWIVRNQQQFGGSILLENQAAYNLWVGNDPRAPWMVSKEFASIPGQAERSRIGFERGIELIAADPPGFARRYLHRFVNLWGFEYFVVRHIVWGGYGPISDETQIALFWILQVGRVVTLSAAVLGLGVWPTGSMLTPLLAYAAVFTALVSAMVGTTRFTVPFAFLLAVSAGLAAANWRRVLRQRRAVVALAALLLLLCVSATRPVFQSFWSADLESENQRRRGWFYFRY